MISDQDRQRAEKRFKQDERAKDGRMAMTELFEHRSSAPELRCELSPATHVRTAGSSTAIAKYRQILQQPTALIESRVDWVPHRRDLAGFRRRYTANTTAVSRRGDSLG